MSCCTRCGGVTYCSDCDADHWYSTPDQETEWLRARVDHLEAQLDLDARLTRARVAMDQGPIPGVEPYPLPTVGDPPLSEYDRALQAGGRVVPLEERIRRLIEAHDYACRLAIKATAWRLGGEPPEDDRSVLVAIRDSATLDVWIGHRQGGRWVASDDGEPLDVYLWRDLPVPPGN